MGEQNGNYKYIKLLRSAHSVKGYQLLLLRDSSGTFDTKLGIFLIFIIHNKVHLFLPS